MSEYEADQWFPQPISHKIHRDVHRDEHGIIDYHEPFGDLRHGLFVYRDRRNPSGSPVMYKGDQNRHWWQHLPKVPGVSTKPYPIVRPSEGKREHPVLLQHLNGLCDEISNYHQKVAEASSGAAVSIVSAAQTYLRQIVQQPSQNEARKLRHDAVLEYWPQELPRPSQDRAILAILFLMDGAFQNREGRPAIDVKENDSLRRQSILEFRPPRIRDSDVKRKPQRTEQEWNEKEERAKKRLKGEVLHR
ncbi:MAG: hypothetical protein Q9162_004309 [Coniocarpon cinnabarinum]